MFNVEAHAESSHAMIGVQYPFFFLFAADNKGAGQYRSPEAHDMTSEILVSRNLNQHLYALVKKL